jgi:hypothetical protein
MDLSPTQKILDNWQQGKLNILEGLNQLKEQKIFPEEHSHRLEEFASSLENNLKKLQQEFNTSNIKLKQAEEDACRLALQKDSLEDVVQKAKSIFCKSELDSNQTASKMFDALTKLPS